MNTPSPRTRSSPARSPPAAPRRTRPNNFNQYGTFLAPLTFNAVNKPAGFRKTNILTVKMPNNRPIDSINGTLGPRKGKFLKGDYAVRVTAKNGRNTYFKPRSFNRWFGIKWRTMNKSNNSAISAKTHPITRARVARKNVQTVQFI